MYPRSILLRHRIRSALKKIQSGERIKLYPDTCGRGLRKYGAQSPLIINLKSAVARADSYR